MARIILSFAIAFFVVMTFSASAAEACVSCEHVPGVARSSPTSNSAKRENNKRVYRSTKKRNARAAKKRIVKRKTTTKKRIITRRTTAKKVETAKTAPINSKTDNQNSTTSTTSLDNGEAIETVAMPEDEPKTSSYVGCKTLSVGCVVAQARQGGGTSPR
jgi:adenine C2-methylase RlmN of 23S rRNA A2503 and tRNA A37